MWGLKDLKGIRDVKGGRVPVCKVLKVPVFKEHKAIRVPKAGRETKVIRVRIPDLRVMKVRREFKDPKVGKVLRVRTVFRDLPGVPGRRVLKVRKD